MYEFNANYKIVFIAKLLLWMKQGIPKAILIKCKWYSAQIEQQRKEQKKKKSADSMDCATMHDKAGRTYTN